MFYIKEFLFFIFLNRVLINRLIYMCSPFMVI